VHLLSVRPTSAYKPDELLIQYYVIIVVILAQLQLEEADTAFSRVFELKPNAYLWQAGIVKFYLGDVAAAGKIFAEAAEACETRFSTPASEERIWRDACELKYLGSISKERKRELKETQRISAIIPAIKAVDNSDNLFGTESRKVVRVARDLFSSSIDSDMSGELLARAKLRSIGGTEKSPKMDRKMWKLTSWFYLGLHYDSLGFFEESKKCMKMALKFGPSSGKSDDIIHTLPLLHMTARDWFDDDDFDEDVVFEDETNSDEDTFSPAAPTQAVASMAYADPLIERSIKEGVSKMKLRELKDALRLRVKKTTGSKEQLQELLFYSLMDDAGFASGFAP
jgi:tetratricopeptide (TPR) repeat protein